MAYSLHYLPFFTMSRSLYLHHYLPAFMLSCMAAGIVFDHHRQQYRAINILALAVSVATIYTFVRFAPITYGTDILTDELNKRKWVSTWDWP
jgi:dolichyl-phosphate-mannose-protein mannosyltransferase